MADDDDDDDDGAITGMTLGALREAWRVRFGEIAPALRSRDLLARAFIYKLEVQREGDMKATLRRRLMELAERLATEGDFVPPTRSTPSIGSALVREWNGVRHIVLVTPHGFQYGETTYASLTKVAKAISGTHQSGPRFFGLVGSTVEVEQGAPP